MGIKVNWPRNLGANVADEIKIGSELLAPTEQQLISAIRVEKLFGLYTYRLPREGVLPNGAILYGDNGVGKSTILRLAFHLLSAAGNRGHRGALLEAPFEILEVDLTSGVTLRAARTEVGGRLTLDLSIVRLKTMLARWIYFPGQESSQRLRESFPSFIQIDKRGKAVLVEPKVKKEPAPFPEGEDAYISVLKQNAPTTFLLNAERRLDSDSVPDPSDEMELRRVLRYEEPKRLNDIVGRSREIALSQALSTAGTWVRKKALQGTNQGSMNVHSVYIDVVRHLVTPSAANLGSEPAEIGALVKQLSLIESRTNEFARYELATELSTTEFKKALQSRSPAQKTLAAELLKPYIKSLESRLDAVEPIYTLIDEFVRTINGFLRDKSISFKQSEGFAIRNRLDSPLKPADLSSGEQQLLLLFSYVLTAREMPSVFIIDEPEISLNIKWQRQLIQSLLDITNGARIQFIFASHSMELLAQHRDRVVRLDDRG
ncbi:ATP-binding protein [Acidobacteria bacterium AB60]|nr:ATP-binding protein [Acidobacteria bacterium AB60]